MARLLPTTDAAGLDMIVVVDTAGQLGNRLLLFAHLVAVAEETGTRVVDQSFSHYRSYFPALSEGRIPTYPPSSKRPLGRATSALLLFAARVVASAVVRLHLPANRLVTVLRVSENEMADLADPDIRRRLAGSRFVLLQGWLFRDAEALERHADLVRRIFTPVSAIARVADQAVKRVRGEGGVVVGVHVRQGDYRVHLGGRFYYPTEAYVRVMERLRDDLDGEVRFLVTTDSEQDWDAFSHLPYERAKGSSVEDLYTLSACDLIVGPPSSFTLWASFYGRTPLAMITDPEGSLGPDDFVVAPDINDPQIAKLY